MPLIFLVAGIALIVTAIQGTSSALLGQLQKDVLPSSGTTGGFGIWILAIFLIGAIGYIPSMKGVSNGLLVLVILVILLSNSKASGGGFFSNFTTAIGLKVTS